MAKQWLHFSQAIQSVVGIVLWLSKNHASFAACRAIGQSVSINPDGHVKLQKATEKPLDIDSLDSTALEFQSDEETSLAKEKLPAMDSLDSTALEFPNGEETSLAKETPPAPPAPPPAIGSLDSAALEFQTVEENSLAEEAPPPAKDSLDSAALEFQNAEENSLARTKLMEAVDAEEKKLWSATVEEMGPIIKIMLQQLQESMAIQNE